MYLSLFFLGERKYDAPPPSAPPVGISTFSFDISDMQKDPSEQFDYSSGIPSWLNPLHTLVRSQSMDTSQTSSKEEFVLGDIHHTTADGSSSRPTADYQLVGKTSDSNYGGKRADIFGGKTGDTLSADYSCGSGPTEYQNLDFSYGRLV